MDSLRHLSSGLAALSAALVIVTLSACPALAATAPGLTPSAQLVQVGETIDLSVTGFSPCSTAASVTLLWDNDLLLYNLVAGSLTSSSFTVDIVVPPSPLGGHQIEAGCSVASQYVRQQQFVLQLQASVNVVTLVPSPQTVQAGRTVTITGSGFPLCIAPAGSATVELSADGTPLATASESNGDFQQVITVPLATAAGPYPVTAQCSGPSASGLVTASVYVVTLVLSSSSGALGTTISVTGDGYTQCHEVQLQLLRDATQALLTISPISPVEGSFAAGMTVPLTATPGNDYQVDAECYPAVGSDAVISAVPFAVTPMVASTSPTPTPTPTPTSASPSPSSPTPSSSSSGSPSPSPTPSSSSSGSPSLFTVTSPPSPGRTSGLWAPVALTGGTGAGLALAALLLLRAVSAVHRTRGRGWVSKHLRVVAGPAGPPSAGVDRRPGATSVSVGLEPHLDHLGNQQYEEVAR